MTNRIRMLQTHPVSPNGLVTMHWPEGSEHTVNDDLLNALIDAGVCELVEDKALKPKMETGAPVQTKRPRRKRKAKASDDV